MRTTPKLVRITDAFDRVVRLDYETYQLHITPESLPDGKVRRRRLKSATYENPPHGPPEVLATWDYKDFDPTNDAYLTRATRQGLTSALSAAQLVTEYDYAHELFEVVNDVVGAYSVNPNDPNDEYTVLGSEVLTFLAEMSTVVEGCLSQSPKASPAFPAVVDQMCGMHWSMEPSADASPMSASGAQLFGLIREQLADNILRVRRGSPTGTTLELESFYEIDPRRAELDRVVAQRFGMVPADRAVPEDVVRDIVPTAAPPETPPIPVVVHRWHSNMPQTAIYTIEGPLTPPATIVTSRSPTLIPNPRLKTSFVEAQRSIPPALLNVLPLVGHEVPPIETEPGLGSLPTGCRDIILPLPSLDPQKPAGARNDMGGNVTALPPLARTETTCASIAARWTRDALISDAIDPADVLKNPALALFSGKRRELLRWDLNLACQFVQVQDRRGVSETYALNFQGQPVAVAAPSPKDGTIQVTTNEYNPDGLLFRVTEPDGSKKEWNYPPERSIVEAGSSVLSRGNVQTYVERTASPTLAQHLAPARRETSSGATAEFTSRTWFMTYEPVYQQMSSLRAPDGQVTEWFFDYQQGLFPPSAMALAFKLYAGQDIPSAPFLGIDLDGDGTRRAESSAGVVVEVARNLELGSGNIGDVGTRYRRDQTGRINRTTNFSSVTNPALDTDRVDYVYYPTLAKSEVGDLSGVPCDCPRGPLAKEISFRSATATAAADKHEQFVVYDPLGGVRLSSSNNDPLTAVTSIRDSLGRPTMVSDAYGKITSYGYDGRGHLRTTLVEGTGTDPLVTITVSATTGEPLGACFELGSGACNGFDAFVVAATLAHRNNTGIPSFIGNAAWSASLYDVDDVVGAVIDAEGGYSRSTRNSAGAVIEQVTSAQTDRRVAMNYDSMGRLLRVDQGTTQGAVLMQTSFQYDRASRLVGRQTRTDTPQTVFTSGIGTIERVGYDHSDNVTRYSVSGNDGAGNRRTLALSRFHPNKLGELLYSHQYAAATPPLESAALPTIPTPTSVTANDAWVTARRRYDQQFRVVESQDEGLAQTSMVYDGFGVIDVNGPAIREQTTKNPSLRTVISTTTRKGVANRQYRRTLAFDGRGLATTSSLQSLEETAVRTSISRFDSLGRLVISEGADGRGVENAYGAGGRLVKQSETKGGVGHRTSRFEHDQLGRVTQEAPDGAPVIKTSYDEAGVPTARTSGRVTRTSTIDAAGRVVEQAIELKSVKRTTTLGISFNRQQPGKVFVDGDGARTISYDGLERPTNIVDNNLVGIPDSSSSTFRSSRPTITTNLSYDTLGRLLTDVSTGSFPATSPIKPNETGVKLTKTGYSWPLSALGVSDAQMNLSGETLSFIYDAAGALEKSVRKGASGNSMTAVFDNEGGLWRSALVTSASGSNAVIDKERDAFGRTIGDQLKMSGSLVRVDVLRGISGRILAERRTTELLKETTGRSYRYDALGRLSEQRIDVKTTQSAAQFVAQRANALANEDLHPFPQTDVVQQAAFTIADGLTSLTGDEEGRQHAANVDPLSDGVPVTSANGDAVTRDDFDRITGSQDLTMTFDVFDRLVLVVRGGKEMLRLAYDGLGNRVIERRYEGGNMVDAVLHRFGGNVVEETQIDGTVIATTMHAPGVDAPLLYAIGKTIAGQKTNALLTNARGDVVAAGDLATGSVTEEQQLDVYGERTIATKANGVCVEGMENGTSSQPRGSTCATKGILGRFGIAGARAHPETKLVDMRARTYATHLKGFLTKDPLGPVDSHSLFGYVAGDPVNMRDPFGLSASEPDGGATSRAGSVETAEGTLVGEEITFHEDGDGDGGSAPSSPPAPTPAPAPSPTPAPAPSPTPTPTPTPTPAPSPSPAAPAAPGAGSPSSKEPGNGICNAACSRGIQRALDEGGAAMAARAQAREAGNTMEPSQIGDGIRGSGGGAAALGAALHNYLRHRLTPDGVDLMAARGVGNGRNPRLKAPQNPRKSLKSTNEELALHRAKLEAYKANPFAFDNQGHLARNAARPDIQQKIIEGRVRHLESEIANFEKLIANWKAEGGQ